MPPAAASTLRAAPETPSTAPHQYGSTGIGGRIDAHQKEGGQGRAAQAQRRHDNLPRRQQRKESDGQHVCDAQAGHRQRLSKARDGVALKLSGQRNRAAQFDRHLFLGEAVRHAQAKVLPVFLHDVLSIRHVVALELSMQFLQKFRLCYGFVASRMS